jgi:serine phosphatase RsbU (regulator of sigma subunit)
VIVDGGQTASHEHINLLLVEDDDGDALLVEDELADVLPRATIVRSRLLTDALSALSPAIDCVLLDLGLPDASGIEAVTRLRARMPSTPLIVLTGLADEAAGVAAVQAGAQDYLIKGHVDGKQLVRSIRYSIGRRQADEAELQAREVARLERGLAPMPLIDDAAVWVGSCYRAGRSRALLGGDFIDLVQRRDGSLHVVVGDVCGHGPDEAAIGVSLRAAWRALVLAGESPGAVLRTLREVFEHERHIEGLFATLCTLEIESDLASVSTICAGHPRPVLIDGSSISALTDGPSCAGLGIGEGPWRSTPTPLPAGWTILLYTDGIIEGRITSGPERLGEEGLHRLIADRIADHPDWRERPRALLDELIEETERLNGEALSDDVAMLLVGVSKDAASS